MKQNPSVLGIDLAKRVFHMVGMDAQGHVVLKKRLTREALIPFVAQLPSVVIGMEACGGAHYWARRLRAQGHEMKLMAPQFVKPYIKSNKHDPGDAEAICAAVTRPTMRFVLIKEVAQQALQSLHRARKRVAKACTALVNEIRSLGMEYGIVLPQGVAKFRSTSMATFEAERTKLTPVSMELFLQLYEEFCALAKQLASYNKKIETIAAAHPMCQRLETIPGIGPLTAAARAVAAAVSDATHFKNGCQFAAWVGLVPRQHSTGGRARLLGISKWGDVYLHTLLVHGARATLRWSGSRRIDGASESEPSSNDMERTKRRSRWPLRTRRLLGCC
jgi:transposase